MRTRVARKPRYPQLPRFAIVPAAALASWKLRKTTTVVECAVNGIPTGRRTVKYWDERRWFLQIPQTLCRELGIDVGDAIGLELRRTSTALPAELARLLAKSPSARSAWSRRTPAQQRMLAEEIRAAKQPATRSRRAARQLLGTSGRSGS